MNIDSIQNGYVFDHIHAGDSLDIIRLLKLDRLDCSVAIIRNARSIKIDELIDLDFDLLGYVDPNITVSTIRNGVQVEKKQLRLPQRLVGVLKCKNPRCITTVDSTLDSEFLLTDAEKRSYCCALASLRYAALLCRRSKN